MSSAAQLGSSPLLFSFFSSELAILVTEKETHGLQFVQDMAQLFLLLFADDVALVSLTPSGLQKQLDNLQAEVDRSKLEVNLAKTSIIVLRKGGAIVSPRKVDLWGCGGRSS